MLKLLLTGCNGKMGKAITAYCAGKDYVKIVAGMDFYNVQLSNYPVYENINDVSEDFDCILDFTRPDAFYGLLDFAQGRGKPIVFATTGHDDMQRAKLNECAKNIPIFISSNMSIGVYILNNVVKQVTRQLDLIAANSGCDPYDIEIIEKHHNKKVDAPSGTAVTLANNIANARSAKSRFVYERESVRQKRGADEIGIHSIRGGTIIGEHTCLFAGAEEVLEFTHKAESSMVFAKGAVAAAQFLHKQPAGLYGMDDLFVM